MNLIDMNIQVNTDVIVDNLIAKCNPEHLTKMILEICSRMDDSFSRRLGAKLRVTIEKEQAKGSHRIGSALQFIKATLSEEEVEILRALL